MFAHTRNIAVLQVAHPPRPFHFVWQHVLCSTLFISTFPDWRTASCPLQHLRWQSYPLLWHHYRHVDFQPGRRCTSFDWCVWPPSRSHGTTLIVQSGYMYQWLTHQTYALMYSIRPFSLVVGPQQEDTSDFIWVFSLCGCCSSCRPSCVKSRLCGCARVMHLLMSSMWW